MNFASNMFLHVNSGCLRGWQRKSVLYSPQRRNLKIGRTQHYLRPFGSSCLTQKMLMALWNTSREKTVSIGPTHFWMIKEIHPVLWRGMSVKSAKNDPKCLRCQNLPN